MAEYEGIIERLSKATGPDVWLDCDIHALLVAQIPKGYVRGSSSGAYLMAHGRGGRIWSEKVPAYTASLDATTELIERVLPGWAWTIDNSGEATISSLDGRWLVSEDMETYALHKSPSIALLLALFRALQAKEGKADA